MELHFVKTNGKPYRQLRDMETYEPEADPTLRGPEAQHLHLAKEFSGPGYYEVLAGYEQPDVRVCLWLAQKVHPRGP